MRHGDAVEVPVVPQAGGGLIDPHLAADEVPEREKRGRLELERAVPPQHALVLSKGGLPSLPAGIRKGQADRRVRRRRQLVRRRDGDPVKVPSHRGGALRLVGTWGRSRAEGGEHIGRKRSSSTLNVSDASYFIAKSSVNGKALSADLPGLFIPIPFSLITSSPHLRRHFIPAGASTNSSGICLPCITPATLHSFFFPSLALNHWPHRHL